MLLGVQGRNAQVSNGQKSPEVLAVFCWTDSGLLVLITYRHLPKASITQFAASFYGVGQSLMLSPLLWQVGKRGVKPASVMLHGAVSLSLVWFYKGIGECK